MPNSKQIVYLSQAQYQELITNGTITVDGVTVTYNENDIYVTPQAEPVTDVRVNGTSIASNGVANVPLSKLNTFGVLRAQTDRGINYMSEGVIQISNANGVVKTGTNMWRPVVPTIQHEATFYGLAKAAGHDEKDSTEPLGTYTPEAKGAIQSMLGVSDLIATTENSLVASKAYAVGDVFTANGKLYKVTTAIAATETIVMQNEGETVSEHNAEETNLSDGFVKKTDVPTVSEPGVVKVNSSFGLYMSSGGDIRIYSAPSSDIKRANSSQRAISPDKQHEAVFYGLTKAAGVDMASSDNAVGTYTDEAKAAIKSMIGVNVEDVQANGVSIVSNGIANIPLAGTNPNSPVYGLVSSGNGIKVANNGCLVISAASAGDCRAGQSSIYPIAPNQAHAAVFFGLAKAAGDTTQSATGNNAVGTYTDSAKASIKSMLGIVDGSTGTVDVTGTTPTITAVENTRYVCGEVSTLSFTPPASGISIVRFTSGTTATALTLPSTVKFPEWFDPTTLETDTIYEICITDGIYGAVMSWAQ